MTLPDKIYSARDLLTSAIDEAAGTAPPVAVPPSAPWWNPTQAQYAAFAARFGVSVSAISPWIQQPNGTITGTAFPKLPAVTTKAAILEYAGFGYKPNGEQALFTEPGFTPRRHLCDLLNAATTQAQADAIVTGAGAPGIEPDAVRLQLMTGLVDVNPFSSPHAGNYLTVDDVVAQLNYVPGEGTGMFGHN